MSDTPRTDAESPNLWVVPAEFAKQLERELAAAIKERDALKQRVAELESQEFTLPHDPFRDPDRDLRERLVCAALTGLIAGNYGSEYDSVAIYAIKHADAVLAAMRKGESNDK